MEQQKEKARHLTKDEMNDLGRNIGRSRVCEQ